MDVEAANGYPVHNLDTGLNYTSIQEAINAPETLNAHTIFVEEGIYFEHVSVSKSLSIIGEQRDTTIVDGSSVGNVIQISADNVRIINFTVRNAGTTGGGGYPDSCILVANAKHAEIANNIITSGTVGVLGYASSNMIVSHNFVYNCDLMGIHLDGNSTSCNIADNSVSDSLEGMELERSCNNTIERNILENNNVSIVLNQCNGINGFKHNNLSSKWYNLIIWGWSIEAFRQDIDATNTVNGKTVYYLTNSNNLILNPSNCPNLGYLAVVNCTNITVKNIDFSSNRDGILFAQSENCFLENVTLAYNFGPLFHGGLTFFESNNNSIIGNRISNNSVAACLHKSNDNIFYGNSFTHNIQDVISNFHSPFSEPSGSYSVNRWDNENEGNYWSKYNGTDLDNDGVGDSPHVLDANNTDHYPLMGMFSNFNSTLENYVQTVCNSTISDFQFNGTAISFNVAGEDGTSGFCRIVIPTALMKDTYRVFVNGTEVSYTMLPVSNSTHSYLYFTYNHSIQEIVIVSEFPSLIILSLFMIATLLAGLVHRRRKIGKAHKLACMPVDAIRRSFFVE